MIAYFDCSNGAAGDMIVAALLNAGVNWDRFQQAMSGLDLVHYRLRLTEVVRGGLRAQWFQVEFDQHQHHHRGLSDILDILRRSKLSERVIADASRVFTRLAEAEAFVHGCEIDKVHFHEVGAVDAIVDIVGACLALELLGIQTVNFSTVAVGSGQVKGSHGILPVPAPATARLLQGFHVTSGNRSGELITPTGAAILTTLGTQRPAFPEFTLRNIGYGAGSRDEPGIPNILTVYVGALSDHGPETDEVAVLTFSVDDITPEHLGMLVEQLFDHGALDVVQIPVFMKKNRSATQVEVLAPPDKAAGLAEWILTQSTSFGVRVSRERRFKLGREFLVVVLPEGKVRVKLGYFRDRLLQISPEFEDCRKIAERTGKNFRHIYARAAELARGELEK